VLDHGVQCKLVRELKKEREAKYKKALTYSGKRERNICDSSIGGISIDAKRTIRVIHQDGCGIRFVGCGSNRGLARQAKVTLDPAAMVEVEMAGDR
jgi:hypothetical protein